MPLSTSAPPWPKSIAPAHHKFVFWEGERPVDIGVQLCPASGRTTMRRSLGACRGLAGPSGDSPCVPYSLQVQVQSPCGRICARGESSWAVMVYN